MFSIIGVFFGGGETVFVCLLWFLRFNYCSGLREPKGTDSLVCVCVCGGG